jgi:hypothetical protein
MRNGYCQFWFEEQHEAGPLRGKTSVEVCAYGGIVATEALVFARQRQPQFPLRPCNYRQLEIGRRRANRLVQTITG